VNRAKRDIIFSAPSKRGVEMKQINKCAELESQIQELREWIKANTRRIEDLEASAFQLLEEEEVFLITVPKKKDMKCA